MSHSNLYNCEQRPGRIVVAPDGSTSYWIPESEVPQPTLSKPGPTMAAIAAWCLSAAPTARSDEQYTYLGIGPAACGDVVLMASSSGR